MRPWPWPCDRAFGELVVVVEVVVAGFVWPFAAALLPLTGVAGVVCVGVAGCGFWTGDAGCVGLTGWPLEAGPTRRGVTGCVGVARGAP